MAVDVMTGEEIQRLLAHRFPFLLLDRALIIEPGRHVVGEKLITSGEWWSESSMSASMTMPRMLILEALAQTSGALIRDLGDGASRSIGYFIGADRVRMRRDARPGETLLLDLTLEQWRRGVCRTRGVATVAGEIILTASLTTIVRAAG